MCSSATGIQQLHRLRHCGHSGELEKGFFNHFMKIIYKIAFLCRDCGMKKKKSKINERQSRAENRNKFFANLNSIFRDMTADLRVSKFTPKFQDFLYNNKIITPKLKPTEGVSKNSDLFLDIKFAMNYVINKSKIKLDIVGKEISIKEYMTIYFDVERIASGIEKGSIIVTEHDKDVFAKFKVEYEKKYDEVKKLLNSYAITATWFFSDFRRSIFWLNYEVEKVLTNKPMSMFNWIFYEKKVESKKFLKDHYNRIAYRFYEIKQEENSNFIDAFPMMVKIGKDKEMELYIQDHVYLRLLERIDTFVESRINVELVKSLKAFEVVRNKYGVRMIVFKFFGKRLGYLTYRIINNEVLLTTFLFLTHDNTPEGEKLNELTGLNKSDKKYLQIDKLSAFSTSDVKNNPELRTLFEKADCGHLFDDEFKPFSEERKEKTLANFMLEYLNK
jgi:hypothetical protein